MEATRGANLVGMSMLPLDACRLSLLSKKINVCLVIFYALLKNGCLVFFFYIYQRQIFFLTRQISFLYFYIFIDGKLSIFSIN